MNPRLSINLCCYNSEKYLKETLDSIINQTYKDWELVVINDGSTDSTEKIILDYKEKGHRIVYYFQENKGLGFSRNQALNLSQGDYIAFIDHDDMWLPEKTRKQIDIMEHNPDIDLVYSNLFMMKNGRKSVCFKKKQPDGYVFDRFLYHYPIAIPTVMVRKKVLYSLCDLFDEKLNLSEEFELFMRILYKSKAAYINEPLAIYRIHNEMSSLKLIERWPEEMAYIIEKFKKMDLLFEKQYRQQLDYMNAKIGYYKARAEMMNNNRINARKYLYPFRNTDFRFYLLYLVTFCPSCLWHIVHSIMAEGAFSRMN